MHSNRRRPITSTVSSFSSFSSDNSYIPTHRRSSPVGLRQLFVRDLNQSQRESESTPTPILPIPRASIHIPRENLVWTTDERPIYIQEMSPSPNPIPRTYISERPLYRIAPSPTPPLPPPPPPPLSPPIPIQYRFIPVPLQRYVPIRTLRRLGKKRYVQEKTPGLCATLCSGGFGTIAALIYLLFALALPITKLVLGILYVNDCPVNKNIPLYMIVSGACGLSIILFLLLSSSCTYYRSFAIKKKCIHQSMICTIAFARGMQGALAVFLFIWFFVGNVWVFGARQRVRPDRPDDTNNYCQPALYWFAFYVLIFTYVYAIFMCFMKFCANFLCCGACDIWKRAFS